MTLLLALLLPQDTPDEGGLPAAGDPPLVEPPPDALPELDLSDPPAEQPEGLPEPAEIEVSPPELSIETGPAESLASHEQQPLHGLNLSTCAARAPVQVSGTPAAPVGQLTLQVEVRRNHVKLVTVTEVDDGLDWLTPCLTREIERYEWPVRRGRFAVPVEVSADES